MTSPYPDSPYPDATHQLADYVSACLRQSREDADRADRLLRKFLATSELTPTSERQS